MAESALPANPAPVRQAAALSGAGGERRRFPACLAPAPAAMLLVSTWLDNPAEAVAPASPERSHLEDTWGSAMFGIGFGELLIVMVIALFLFGNRLPEVARSLGKSLTEFRKEVRHLDEEVRVPVR